MNRSEAYALGRSLMDEHGLGHWSLYFDRAKRRLGQTRFSRREIGLSEEYVANNAEHLVRDTILHEIAHALVGSQHGHNATWRAKCREIGAKPQRCKSQADGLVQNQQFKWSVTCPNCGPRGGKHRKSNKPSACGTCCKRYNGGRFTSRFLLQYRQNY